MPSESLQPVTTQQDATYVAPEIPEDPNPRQAAINEAHDDAVAHVQVMTGATMVITAATGNLHLTPVTGGIMYASRLYLDCYKSCHDQSPPKEPYLPEIETEDEEEEEKKLKKLIGENP